MIEPPQEQPLTATPPAGPASPTLILLRHGETVGQSSIRLHGATDVALSRLGEQQAERAAAALAHLRLARVLSSPLQRARRTAEIVLAAQAQPPPGAALEVVPDLREIDFGAWEGWTYAEAEQRDPDNFQRWRSDGLAFDYPGGEPRSSFRARVHAAARASLGAPDLGAPGPTLAVLHKGVIKAVLAALTGQDPAQLASLPVSLGSLHRLQWRDDAWHLISHNDTTHLGELDLGC
jgi:broad specificity phosphatase PhoE